MDASANPDKPQNRFNPRLPKSCDLSTIVEEVSSGSFAKRQKLSACAVKGVWEALCTFICESVKLGKGVVVPTLGYFYVGRVYDNGVLQDDRVIRPTFRLLENRFAGVKEDLSRFTPAQRGRLIQPNFHTIARRCRLHRSVCQRVVRDLLVNLGVHMVAGHQLKVEFPLVGQLLTSHKGNVTFEFSSFLLQGFGQFELKAPRGVDAAQARAKSKMVGEFANEAILFPGPKSSLTTLRKLCRAEDRINSGCIPRLQVERWLQRELRSLVADLDAETILDMLTVHTYGKSGRFILYPAFIDALAAALGASESGHTKIASKKAAAAKATSGANEGRAKQAACAAQDLEDSAAGMSLQHHFDAAAGMGGGAAAEEGAGFSPERPGTAASRPGTACSYYTQWCTKVGDRADVDAFNRVHFARLQGARGGGITPKVGMDPLNVEEVRAFHEQLSEEHDPMQRAPSPDMRRRIALQSVTVDEEDGVLLPIPRPMPDPSEQESLRAQIQNEKEVALAKRFRIRDALQSSWQAQSAEKAKLSELFRNSEAAWPYGPVHRPEVRLPLAFPRQH